MARQQEELQRADQRATELKAQLGRSEAELDRSHATITDQRAQVPILVGIADGSASASPMDLPRVCVSPEEKIPTEPWHVA